MILYQGQVINLTTYDEPAIFLGYDVKDPDKLWALCISKNNKMEVDWFMEKTVEYHHFKQGNKATPNGRIIFFGKYADKSQVMTYYDPEIFTEAQKKEMFEYVVELYEKYKKQE